MRSPRTLLPALVLATLAVTAGAAPVHAAPDPRIPRCVTTGTQTVVAGELTVLSARCSAPGGAVLAASALNGTAVFSFGALLYQADDASLGYDKITVHLASAGPSGPSATVLVRVVGP